MPSDLTSYSLSEVYSSFLHFPTVSASTSFQQMFDGRGTGTALFLSTTAVGVIGELFYNGIRFFSIPQQTGDILVYDGTSNSIGFKSVINVLSSQGLTDSSNGVYSAPVVTVNNGVIRNIYSTGGYKTFYIASRGVLQSTPSNSSLISAIVWIKPVTGDIADVIQKVYTDTTLTTLQDLKIYRFTFDGTTWGIPTII